MNPVITNILRLFSKKEEPLGYWCAVKWSNEAIETGIGYSFLKEIVHMINRTIVGVEPYSEAKVKELRRKDVVVVQLDKVVGVVPKDTVFVPKTERILGLFMLEENVK